MECPRCKDGTLLVISIGHIPSHYYSTYTLQCPKCNLMEWIERNGYVPPYDAISDLKGIVRNKHYPKKVPSDAPVVKKRITRCRVEQRKRLNARRTTL